LEPLASDERRTIPLLDVGQYTDAFEGEPRIPLAWIVINDYKKAA